MTHTFKTITLTNYEAWTLLELSVFRCWTRVVFGTDTRPTHIITLNYVIFSNY